jgi:hypothetical protein
MSTEAVDISLGSILMAILERYQKIEVSPAALLKPVDPDYQLKIEFNEETEMFEITLEEPDAS